MASNPLKVVSDRSIRIEKGVPLPERHSRKGRPAIYPVGEMEVGDSFFVPAPEEDAARIATIIRATAQGRDRKAARDGKKFSVYRVPGGVRCWRVS